MKRERGLKQFLPHAMVFVLVSMASAAWAQQPPAAGAPQGRGGPPPPPQNLQVLPQKIAVGEVFELA